MGVPSVGEPAMSIEVCQEILHVCACTVHECEDEHHTELTTCMKTQRTWVISRNREDDSEVSCELSAHEVQWSHVEVLG